MENDSGVGRTLEAQGLAKIFLCLFDELRMRKFGKYESLNVAREMIFSFMDYKSAMDAVDNDGETFIMFTPEDPNNPPDGCNHG